MNLTTISPMLCFVGKDSSRGGKQELHMRVPICSWMGEVEGAWIATSGKEEYPLR